MAIETIGVVGAGVMGAGIAQVTATAGFTTVCHDLDAEALARAAETVTTGRYGFERGVERGKLTRDEADAAHERLSFSPDLGAAVATDLVIEAVPERLDLKIRLLRDIDRQAPSSTILASNSSGFPITALGAATDRADRVVGWHWASPAPVMALAEIVRAPDTSDATVDAVVDAARRCGKDPVVVRDAPNTWGYVSNRVYFAMVAEAQRVVSEGVATADDVDRIMVDCFRWPTGPFGMVAGATSGWS